MVEADQQLASAELPEGGDAGESNYQTDSVGERGNWQPVDADGFHWALSLYTRFEGEQLMLDHRYLDFRDIELLERLEALPKDQRLDDDDIIQKIEALNETNPNKDCRRLYLLLRELQTAAGNKHTVRQINTKHINTRSRWSVPFKSLNEVGFLIKNQALRGAKSKAKEIEDALAGRRRTNIERKNLAAAKSLRKFIKYKELYWCPITLTVPDAQAQANIAASYPDIDDVSEPERWMRAMIRRHGQQMVAYLDKCAVNLANTYYSEIAQRQDTAALPLEPISVDDADHIVRLLGNMVDEVSIMTVDSKQKKGTRRRAGAPGQRKRTAAAADGAEVVSADDTPLAAAVASKTPEAPAPPVVSLAPVAQAAPAAGDAPEYKRPTSSRPTSGHAAEGGYMDESGHPLLIKKSRSHIFNVPDDAPTIPPHQSYLGMAAYDSMASIAGTLLRGPNDGSISNPVTAVPGRAMPYDDGLFTQFINYDSSSGTRAQAAHRSTSIAMGQEADGSVPADLADAIFNLTVNTGSTPAPHAIGHHRQHRHPHHHAPSDPLTYGGNMSHPVTAYNQGDSFDKTHPTNHYSAANGHRNQTMSSNSRSTSDDVHIPGVYVDSHEGPAELQGFFGSKDHSFTFQMAPYPWSSEGMHEDGGMLPAQHYQNPPMLSQSMSYPSLASYESGLGAAHYGGYPARDYSGGIQIGGAGSPPATSNGAAQMGATAQSLFGQAEPGKSKLSTTLIYVNGVPSHIELVHDSNGVQQNPIILPISYVKEKR